MAAAYHAMQRTSRSTCTANFASTEFSEVRIAQVHYRKGALAPHASPPDAPQGIVHMHKGASEGYCVGPGFTVWCIHSKHWECACSHAHPCALARKANPS